MTIPDPYRFTDSKRGTDLIIYSSAGVVKLVASKYGELPVFLELPTEEIGRLGNALVKHTRHALEEENPRA